MSDKLKDPSKAAQAIIEVLEDGDAIRNDGVRLQAANKNPWYVLATIYGEQEEGAGPWDYDEELAAKNRRAWNGWYCGELSDEDRADRAKKAGLEPEELAPLSEEELDEIDLLFITCMGVEAELPAMNESIDFSNTFFSKPVFFDRMIFENGTSFDSATFTGYAYFISATFMDSTYFSSATFTGCADFSSAKFKSTTRFTEARFLTSVPQFHATVLYDDTVFSCEDADQGKWPPLRGAVTVEGEKRKVMPAADQKYAYNRLRLFMNKSLQLDEEQFFHRQEMRCKREVEPSKRMRLLYDLFEGVSDFGNSVLRPARWLFAVWLSGMIAKLDAVQGGWLPDYHSILPAMGWSFANLFSFFGFQRRYFGVEELSPILQVFGGVQTVFGFILLFFLGLGLRNRFRLR